MQHIDNPAGLGFLESLMYFIKNEKEISKVLAEIHTARDDANVRIAAVGKIGDIESLVAQAQADRSEASGALSDAKRDAASMLQKAGVKSQTEKARQAEAAEVLSRQEERNADLDTRERGMVEREEVLREREIDAGELATKAETQLSKARALSAETDAKLETLRAALAQVE